MHLRGRSQTTFTLEGGVDSPKKSTLFSTKVENVNGRGVSGQDPPEKNVNVVYE